MKPGEDTKLVDEGMKNKWHWSWIEEVGRDENPFGNSGNHEHASVLCAQGEYYMELVGSCPSNSTHLTLTTADIRPSMTDCVLQSSQPSLGFVWSNQPLQHFQVCPYCRLYGKYFETTEKVNASLLQRVETSGFQNKTWVLNVLYVRLLKKYEEC